MRKTYFVEGKALDLEQELVKRYSEATFSFEGTPAFVLSLSTAATQSLDPHKSFTELYDLVGKERIEAIITSSFQRELENMRGI